jgi:23S rRNA pseudouridine2605 synthase
VTIDAHRPLPRRLRKRVAQSLALSLHDVDDCWRAGRLRVVTPECAEARSLPLEALVFADDVVLLDGKALGPVAATVCALLNKPKGVTSTACDPRGKADLSPYLQAMPSGCFAVGRLDRETTGLLLFTNDGDLANAVLRPDHRTAKLYWLWLDEAIPEDDLRLARLVEGVAHNGERLAAQTVSIVAKSEYATELALTLTQGRKRQVRNMCAALGLPLVHLHRREIGPLTDAGLALGSWRLLEATEIEALWQAVGGRAELRRHKVAALVRQASDAREAGTPDTRLEHWLDGESRFPEIVRPA